MPHRQPFPAAERLVSQPASARMRPTLAAGPREFKLTRAAPAPSINRMRALAAVLLVIAAALPAWAQSPLVAELRVWSTRYNENVQKIDELRTALEQAARQNADLDTLLALSQVCFMYGDVRAKTPEEKLESYDRGRQAAKRAIELAPKSAPARFWYGTNTGRWGQTKGIMRSLFLLPTVKGAMETALELDPGYAPAYALGGSIYYEVPGFAGGDLDRSEALFRKGLDLDPHYTNMRVGLARTLSKKGRVADARREALTVLEEKAPSNPADWIVKDVPQAKALLDQIKERP
jgi:tetratricopeptide (TPR) repeat protein